MEETNEQYCIICGAKLDFPIKYKAQYCSFICWSKNQSNGTDGVKNNVVPRYLLVDSSFTRHCHDCGKPCTDYRCPKCWAKRRKKLRLEGDLYGEEDV